MALAAAHDLPQLGLADALELTILVARKDPQRHPRVAAAPASASYHRRVEIRGGTGGGTIRAFATSTAHLTRGEKRVSAWLQWSDGPGRSRTSAHGFEVRCSIR